MSHETDRRCPSEDVLLLYHDAALPADEAAPVERHALHCAACQATLDAAEHLDALILVEEGLPAATERRLERLPARAARGRSVILLGLGSAAAAAVLLLASGLDLRAPKATHPPILPISTSPSPVADGPSRLDLLRAHLLDPTPQGYAWIEERGVRLASALHRLARDDDMQTRRAALAWLADDPQRGSLLALVHALKERELRPLALRGLVRLGDKRAVPSIAPFLDDADLGPAALDAMTTLGGERAVDVLLGHIEAAEDAAMGVSFVAALGRISGRSAVAALVDLTAKPDLTVAALAALRTQGREVVPHLLARATGHETDAARAAIRVLAHLAPADAAGSLGRLLDRRVLRVDAARALVRIDTPTAAEALVRHAGDARVRELFRGAGVGVEAWLAARLDPQRRAVCRRHIDLLGLCGGDLAVQALVGLAEDPVLGPTVVKALGGIGTEDAILALAPLTEQSALRRPVVEALGTTGRSEAVGPLLALVRRHHALRGAVRLALGAIDHPDAVRALLHLDTYASSPRATRRTLAAMDRAVVLTTLNAMIDDGDSPSAHRMLASLRTHTSP